MPRYKSEILNIDPSRHPKFTFRKFNVPVGETKNGEGETKDGEGESKDAEDESEDETKEDEGETNAAEGESKATEGETNAAEGKTNAAEGEPKDPQGEANADKAEINAVKGETNADKGETKAAEGETRAAEGEINEAEGAPKNDEGEPSPDEGETTPVEGETATSDEDSPLTFMKRAPWAWARPEGFDFEAEAIAKNPPTLAIPVYSIHSPATPKASKWASAASTINLVKDTCEDLHSEVVLTTPTFVKRANFRLDLLDQVRSRVIIIVINMPMPVQQIVLHI
jgi:hypothetical protein